jgi:starch-binding outer membrane protein, SusD/RagB family
MKCMWFKKSNCICIASMLIILTVTDCKKLVQVDEPDDSLSAGAVFSNDSLAQAAVAGLYIKVLNTTRFLLNGGMSLFPGLSADELERTSPSNFEDQFNYNGIFSNNQLVNVNLWKAAYIYIYQCNICMEGLQRSSGVSAEVKKRLTGEVQFVRALCYYYLVNLYGDVPLVLGTNADVNTLLPRTQADELYKQMEADLLGAFNALSDNKTNTFPTPSAAQALLARIYLHLQNWNKAEEMASTVINSGQFMLQADLNTVFKRLSKEIIFQWAPVVDKTNAPEGVIFVPANAALRPTYTLTGLLTAFEAGDLRKANWIKTVKIGAQNYDYPYKYKIYVSSSAPSEYNVVLRLAEQYLIRAEALARQNKITEAVADINTIRMRAQLPGISASISSEECFQAIEKERRIELFAEWGHRWFDLKRTNRANAVLSASKGSNWHSNDQLYPIPFSELEADPNLRQNPGYE